MHISPGFLATIFFSPVYILARVVVYITEILYCGNKTTVMVFHSSALLFNYFRILYTCIWCVAPFKNRYRLHVNLYHHQTNIKKQTLALVSIALFSAGSYYSIIHVQSLSVENDYSSCMCSMCIVMILGACCVIVYQKDTILTLRCYQILYK